MKAECKGQLILIMLFPAVISHDKFIKHSKITMNGTDFTVGIWIPNKCVSCNYVLL